MTTILMVLVGLSMAGTLGVMFAGMLGLVRTDPGTGTGTGNQAGSIRSNKLMRWRVIMQATTIALFLLLLAVTRR